MAAGEFIYTLQSTNRGMCDDLLADAGYDQDEHADTAEAMAFAADLAAVDVAYEVMREHGLEPLADQAVRAQLSEDEGHG